MPEPQQEEEQQQRHQEEEEQHEEGEHEGKAEQDAQQCEEEEEAQGEEAQDEEQEGEEPNAQQQQQQQQQQQEEDEEDHEREHVEDDEEDDDTKTALAAEASTAGAAASKKQIHAVASSLNPAARLHQAAADVIFDRCLAYLQARDNTEGLFMLQPSLTRVRQLQLRILTGEAEAAEEEDEGQEEEEEGKGGRWGNEHRGSRGPSSPVSSSPHEVATLLLQHLQVRPQPLIPSSLYSSLLACWTCAGGVGTGNQGEGRGDGSPATDPAAAAAAASPPKPAQHSETTPSPPAPASPPVAGSTTSPQPLPLDTVAEEEGEEEGEGEGAGEGEKEEEDKEGGQHVLRLFIGADGADDNEDQEADEARQAEEFESGRKISSNPTPSSPPTATTTTPPSPSPPRASISIPQLARVLSHLPPQQWKQLEGLLFLLRRVATSPTAGTSLHAPTTAALASVVGPLLARPQGSAHLSIRHAKDLPALASLGAAMIQHAPELLVTREGEEEEGGRKEAAAVSGGGGAKEEREGVAAGAQGIKEEEEEEEVLPPSSPLGRRCLKLTISPHRYLQQHYAPSQPPSTPPPLPAAVTFEGMRSNVFRSPSRSPAAAAAAATADAAAGQFVTLSQQHKQQQYYHQQQQQQQQVQVARLVLHEQLMPALTSKLFSARQEDLLSLGPGLVPCPAAAVAQPQPPCDLLQPQQRPQQPLPPSSCAIVIPSSSSSSPTPIDCLPSADPSSFPHSPPPVPTLCSLPLQAPTSPSSSIPPSLPPSLLPRADLLRGCQALREEIATFEAGFKREHGGRPPKGQERLPLASTYQQYRQWKRLIREGASRVLQRMVRRWRARRGRVEGGKEGISAAAPAGAAAASLPACHSALPVLEIASGITTLSSSKSSSSSKASGRSPAAKVKSKASTSSSSAQAKEKAPAPSSSLPPSLPPSPELQALLEEKKGIKTRLKRFDSSFQAKHGRAPSKQEKEPVRSVYEKYNRLKGRIAALEQKVQTQKEALQAHGRGGASSSSSSSRSSRLNRPTVASASRARTTAEGREGGREGVGGGLPPQSPRRSSSPSTGLSSFQAHDHSRSLPRTPTTMTSSSSSNNNSGTGGTPPISPRSPIAAASSAASAFPSSSPPPPPPPPPPSSFRQTERTLRHLRLAQISTSIGNLAINSSSSSSSSSTVRPFNPSTFASSVGSSKRPTTRTALSSSFPPSASGPVSDVDLLLLEKKRLHAHLRKFERAFQKEHGRRVLTAGDILPVDEEYKRYKRVKAQLAQLGVVGKKEKGQGKGGSRGNY